MSNKDNSYLNKGATINLQMPKDLQVPREKVDEYLAVFYNGENWEYIFPDIEKVSQGYISFKTDHFSLFAAARPTEEERIKLYTKKMAVQVWEMEEQEQDFNEKIMETFNETFEKMGITDESVKGKLLRSVAKEYDFGTLLVATERGDLADFGVKCGEMASNVLIKHLSLEDALMENITSKGAAVASGLVKGAMQLKDGNYTDAAKELTGAFVGYFPVGRAYQAAVEVIEASIASWKDYELDDAYNNYVKNTSGNATRISDEDWSLMCVTQMRGYLVRIQEETKATHCRVTGMSRKALDGDPVMSERLAKQASSNLRKLFERRLAKEQTVKEKELEYADIIEGFKRDLLLERGSFGFAFDMDIETRLRTLFSARQNILELFGGEMSESDLNEAIGRWISYGPKNRAEFYKWFKEKGYAKDSKPSGGEFAWVLSRIVDFPNDEGWARANEHPSYAYTHDYSKGSYAASVTYEGVDTYGQGLAGTFAVQAVFSGMPEVIYPDQPVSINLSFTTTENNVVKLNFRSSAIATFDKPDLKPGSGTARARYFTNKDGESSFPLSSKGDVASYQEVLTAELGSGFEAGEEIALRTSCSLGGVSMVTHYIYVWEERN